MNYQSGSASVFATAARKTGPTYTVHFDVPNQKWNVFEVMYGHELFVQAFDTLKLAQSFCNGEVA